MDEEEENVEVERRKVTKLKPVFFFGLSCEVKGNAHFSENDTIVYLIGRVFVFHGMTDRLQTYIKIPDSTQEIMCVAMSPSRHYIAVAEKHISGRPAISIYSIEHRKRIKIFGNPLKKCVSKEFLFVSFTCDSRQLIAITGPPDWLMMCYNWKISKPESYVKAIGKDPTTSVTQMECSPFEPTKVVVVGRGLFRMLHITDGIWKQIGFSRAEKLNVTSVCWLAKALVLFGTIDGRLVLIEHSELKGVYMVDSVSEVSLAPKKERNKVYLSSSLVPPKLRTGEYEVRCLTRFPRGFAYSSYRGNVTVFEKIHETTWIKRNVFYTSELDPISDMVRVINISPSQDQIVCTTGRKEIYYGNIFEDQNFDEQPKKNFKVLRQGYHHGSVRTVGVCPWRRWFFTVGGDDHTLRIWDFDTKDLILVGELEKNILSADFHPFGWWCIVGFEDCITVFAVTLSSMIPIHEVPVSGCLIVKYSRSGHLFAAANGLNIHVYTSIYFERLWTFLAHTAAVSGLYFTNRDFYLCSCGLDGIVIKWDLGTGKSIEVCEASEHPCFGITATRTGDFIFVVGTDNTLKEIHQGVVTREIILNQFTLYNVALGNYDATIFLSGEKGTMLTLSYPFEDPPAFKAFSMHSHPITKMVLTQIDRALISLDTDGVMGLWKIKCYSRDPPPFTELFPQLTDVFILAEEWEEKQKVIEAQRQRMEEMLNKHKLTMTTLTAAHDEKIKEVTDSYQQRVNDLKLTLRQTINRHRIEVFQVKDSLASSEDYYTKEKEKQGLVYDNRLANELKEQTKLKIRLNNLIYEGGRVVQAIQAANKSIFKTNEYFCFAKMTKAAKQTEELIKEINNSLRRNEIVKLIVEEDFEKEIIDRREAGHKRTIAIEDEIEGLRAKNDQLQEKTNEMVKLIETDKMALDELKRKQDRCENIALRYENELNELQRTLAAQNEALMAKDVLIVTEMRKQEEFNKERLIRDMHKMELKRIVEPIEHNRRSWRRTETWLKSELDKAHRTLAKMGMQTATFKKMTKTLLQPKNVKPMSEMSAMTIRQRQRRKRRSREPPTPSVVETRRPHSRSEHPTLFITSKSSSAAARNAHFLNTIRRLKAVRALILEETMAINKLKVAAPDFETLKGEPEFDEDEFRSVATLLAGEIQELSRVMNLDYVNLVMNSLKKKLEERNLAISRKKQLTDVKNSIRVPSLGSIESCFVGFN